MTTLRSQLVVVMVILLSPKSIFQSISYRVLIQLAVHGSKTTRIPPHHQKTINHNLEMGEEKKIKLFYEKSFSRLNKQGNARRGVD